MFVLSGRRSWIKFISAVFLLPFLMTIAPAANAQSGEPIKVRIGWQPAEELNFFIARDAKLFEQEGLAPEFLRFNAGPPMLAALRSGELDIGYMGSPPAVAAIAQGIPIDIFFIETDAGTSEGLVVQGDSGIKTAHDLKGKTIGVWRGTSADFALGRILEKENIGSGDIKLLDLDVTALIAAFRTKQVDGIHVWDPWALRAEELGGRKILRDADYGIHLPMVWLGRKEWLQNPEGGKRFIKALMGADAIRRADPGRAASVAASVLGFEIEIAKKLITRNYYFTAQELADPKAELSMHQDAIKNGTGALKAISDIAAFLVRAGRVKEVQDLGSRIDPRPLQLNVGR